jgi:hypothetical protein
MTTSSLPPGDPLRLSLERALGERYDVVRLLGRGGMGAVFLAREHALDRLVAIKVLPPETAGGATSEGRERFRREARTVAKLQHPNIVPLHAFGEAEGLLYFVMGYVRGESLADRIRHEGKLPGDDVRRILAEIGDALDYAHRYGIVHRDVKPDNIMLEDESGRPMLTDFGVARVNLPGGALTQSGTVVGTAHYMSPEQAAGDGELDGRSDLYSLGVVGYAMLAGQPPFQGRGFWEVVAQHAAAEPPPLRVVRPEVPDDLITVVMQCLAKEPAKRIPDGRSLKEMLGVSFFEEDDAVSGELREVSGAVFWSLATAWVLVVTIGVLIRVFGSGWWSRVGPWALLLVPGLYLLTAAVHRRKGVTWPDVARVVRWPPKWWPLPWPSGWRRPGDVWDRLPTAVLRLRRYYGLVVATALLTLPLLVYGGSRTSVLAVTLYGFLMLVTVGMLLTAWWAHRSGFPNNADLRSLVLGSTVNRRFWKKPAVARLLRPAAAASMRTASGPDPVTAPELLRALLEGRSRLGGIAHELRSEAIAAARQAVATVDALDREIETLAADADPDELARLEARLASRELVIELLRTLWLQVADVRASEPGTHQAEEVTARVRAACADLDRYAAALAEAER